MAEPVSFGDILLIALPTHAPRGHEQEGTWSRKAPGLYPRLRAGAGGLPHPSVALLDQLRSIDVQRVTSYLGSLAAEEFQPIDDGLKKIFGFTAKLS